MLVARFLAPALLGAAVLAAPAGAAVAPGAATYALPGGTHEGPFSHGFDAGVAEPGGGATLATSEPGKGLVLMRVTGAGVIDRNFGVAGRAHVPVPSDRDVNDPAPVQVSRLADGRLLVVGYGQDVPYSSGAPQLVVSRLSADGRLDLSYGDGGRAQPGVETGCYCSAAAVLTDGRFALTGQTAGRWTVAVLTPDGGLDTAFGSDGIATVAGDGLGFAAAAAPNGGVVVLGMVDRNVQLSELTAAGAPDRAFHDGYPIVLADRGLWSGPIVRADGSVDVLGAGAIRRFTASGQPDLAFGSAGIAPVPVRDGTLLADPFGGSVVVATTESYQHTSVSTAKLARFDVDGRVITLASVRLPFGGGVEPTGAEQGTPPFAPLRQNGFVPSGALVRPDGGVLVTGAVTVAGGEGNGVLTNEGALAAFTPALALDPTFGGRRSASLRLTIPSERVSTAPDGLSFATMAVTITTSGPGVLRLRVRSRDGRLLAAETDVIHRAGTSRRDATLTALGLKRLRRAHRIAVDVRATFRDLVGTEATATARAALR